MIHCTFARILLCVAFAVPAFAATQMPSREAPWRDSPAATFRAPEMTSRQLIGLEAPLEKSAAGVEEQPGGRIRVATVRPLPKAASVDEWTAIQGGLVARLDASSLGAEGLRVRLDIADSERAIEVRVQGSHGRIEALTIDAGRNGEGR